MTKYKYCVKIRFSSELYTQPDWVTVSWHEKREDAENAQKLANNLRKAGYSVDVWAHAHDGAHKTDL